MNADTEKKYPTRTPLQNNALHKLCEQLAVALNDSGYEQKITIGTIDTPWTKWSVKVLFQKIGKAMFGKSHTSTWTTKEIQEVYEVLNRHLGQRFGLHVPFPSVEEIMAEHL